MKRGLTILMMCAGLAACKGGDAHQEETPPAGPQRDRVEGLYFHTPKRCATCAAIEEETRRVVEEQFAGQLRDSSLVFRVIDLSQEENKALAKRYGAAWSSLFLTRWREGRDSTLNLTLEAFAKANANPEAFKSELARKITMFLK